MASVSRWSPRASRPRCNSTPSPRWAATTCRETCSLLPGAPPSTRSSELAAPPGSVPLPKNWRAPPACMGSWRAHREDPGSRDQRDPVRRLLRLPLGDLLLEIADLCGSGRSGTRFGRRESFLAARDRTLEVVLLGEQLRLDALIGKVRIHRDRGVDPVR